MVSSDYRAVFRGSIPNSICEASARELCNLWNYIPEELAITRDMPEDGTKDWAALSIFSCRERQVDELNRIAPITRKILSIFGNCDDSEKLQVPGVVVINFIQPNKCLPIHTDNYSGLSRVVNILGRDAIFGIIDPEIESPTYEDTVWSKTVSQGDVHEFNGGNIYPHYVKNSIYPRIVAAFTIPEDQII
ncbi:hypothetical protein KDA00_05285 [Candidatus Saccharibacteria bacterium]|nr:hypothetical protein [Candidatus Saccharibacteria bacterium]